MLVLHLSLHTITLIIPYSSILQSVSVVYMKDYKQIKTKAARPAPRRELRHLLNVDYIFRYLIPNQTFRHSHDSSVNNLDLPI